MNLQQLLYNAIKSISIRKVVLVLILIACLIFIFVEKDSFLKTRSFFNGEKIQSMSTEEKDEIQKDPSLAQDEITKFQAGLTPKNSVSMLGNKTISQTFTARESGLAQVQLFFQNPANYKSSGKIIVSVENEKGKKLCSAKLDTNLISNSDLTKFDFSGNTLAINSNEISTTLSKTNQINNVNLTVGDQYTIIIQSQNVKSPKAFGLYLCDEKYTDNENLIVPASTKNLGEKLDESKNNYKNDRLYSSVQYYRFSFPVFSVMVGGLLLAMLFILLPLYAIEENNNRKRELAGKKPIDLPRRLLRIIFFATPFISFWIMTTLGGYSFFKSIILLFSFRGLLNMMIIGALWWVAYTCCNRVKYTTMITTLTVFFFCLGNYILLLFRDSPLIAGDFANIGTGLGVMGTYTMSFDRASLCAITITIIWVCINLSLKSHKGLTKKKRIAAILLSVAWLFTFNFVMFASPVIKNHDIQVSGFKPKLNYKNNGTVLSFFITVKTSFVDKPSDYSMDTVKELTKNYTSDTAKKQNTTNKTSPNIIVVMNEAYSDLRAVGDIPLTEEYMPFYKSLKKDTIKGTMYSSIFGGSTANTEFEFLTGNTMSFLPFHALPYTNMIKDEIPSLTWDLKAQGYEGNIAFHPGMENSYNRDKVYPLLGFDKHIALEDLKNPDLIRSYVSDQQDYDIVQDEYEKYKKSGKENPFYMFNVTIQNHSSYKISTGIVSGNIDITNDELREEEAVQYINLMKKSDDALKNLVSYYQNINEPTVIVLFGDHQPRVGDTFYDALYGKESDDLTLEETSRKYEIPFMIWANYDIKEKENVEISANYLSSYMLQQTGGAMTGYNKYLMDLYKKLPVVTAICYKDKNGNLYDSEKESKYTDLLNQYQMIQYNGFNDKNNRLDEFFYLK